MIIARGGHSSWSWSGFRPHLKNVRLSAFALRRIILSQIRLPKCAPVWDVCDRPRRSFETIVCICKNFRPSLTRRQVYVTFVACKSAESSSPSRQIMASSRKKAGENDAKRWFKYKNSSLFYFFLLLLFERSFSSNKDLYNLSKS